MRVELIDANVLARNWWVVMLRGLVAILFGIATFVAPGISLLVLVLMFGGYALADGVLALASAIRGHGSDRWWVLLLQGIVGIGAAVVTLVWPGITAFALVWVIAAWALVTGAFEVVVAFRLRRVIAHEWLLALSGLASIVLGILLMTAPAAGALVLVLWIGAYALVSGALLVALALRLRSWGRTPHGASPPHRAHAYA